MRQISMLMAAMVTFILSTSALAASPGKYFDRAIFVIFENTNYSSAIVQPFFKQLADQGAHFSNFTALTHPSQGNYIALTSGDLQGVTGDSKVDVSANSIVDLLEAKGLTWKVYVEDYPGNCYAGLSSNDYVRKHNPFISYVNILKNATRCANIVNSAQFDQDAAHGTLPNYAFYIPNMKNDGHDTGVDFADKWYSKKFSSYLKDSNLMKRTVLISTFDESGKSSKNQIYTSIVGPAVRPAVVASALNLYSLLALLEENWSLGSLGQQDVSAPPVPNIWM